MMISEIVSINIYQIKRWRVKFYLYGGMVQYGSISWLTMLSEPEDVQIAPAEIICVISVIRGKPEAVLLLPQH